jgi:hypothetical protein
MRVRHAAAAACLGIALLGGAAGAPAALASTPTTKVVPDPSAPGTSTTFGIVCSGASSATLFGATLGLPEQIPMQNTGQSTFVATVTLPTGIQPGSYHPALDCSNGQSATITVTVSAVPGQAPQTGAGTTSTTTNGTLADIGFGVMGLGAAGAAYLLGRRRLGRRI